MKRLQGVALRIKTACGDYVMRELEPSEFNKVTGGTAMLDHRVAYVRDGKIYDINGDVMGAHSPADPFTLGADGSLQPNPILAAAEDQLVQVLVLTNGDIYSYDPAADSPGDGFADQYGLVGVIVSGFDGDGNGLPDNLDNHLQTSN